MPYYSSLKSGLEGDATPALLCFPSLCMFVQVHAWCMCLSHCVTEHWPTSTIWHTGTAASVLSKETMRPSNKQLSVTGKKPYFVLMAFDSAWPFQLTIHFVTVSTCMPIYTRLNVSRYRYLAPLDICTQSIILVAFTVSVLSHYCVACTPDAAIILTSALLLTCSHL